MTFLQHFYTSFYDPEEQRGGFRTKAMSPGLSPETLDTLLRQIGYRIPMMTEDSPIGNHPIGLRYCQLNGDMYALICSVSSGTDEGGRSGNFFAHSLVAPRSAFEGTIPISYFGHPMWKHDDPETRKDLPTLKFLGPEPSLAIQQVWEFLELPERREQLRQLINAAVRASTTSRRIVIVDSAEHVALWVAALTFGLPPHLRPQLTFSTYHYDTYSSTSLITGTTAGTSFQGTEMEYRQFVVLHAGTGRMSEIEASAYSNYVTERLTSERYKELDPFFEFADRRMRPDDGIDTGLDRIFTVFALLTSGKGNHLDSGEIDLLRELIAGFERTDQPKVDDIADLTLTTAKIRAALAASANTSLIADYRRASAICAKHDPLFSMYLSDDLDIVVDYVMSRDIAGTLMTAVCDAYGEETVKEAVNEGVFLDALTHVVTAASDSLQSARNVWQVFGAFVAIGDSRNPLLLATLDLLDSPGTPSLEPAPPEQQLLETLAMTFAHREAEFLKVAASAARPEESVALRRMYYELVSRLPLRDRTPFRDIVRAVFKKVHVYEYQRDLYSVPPAEVLTVLERWLHDIDSDEPWKNYLTQQAFDRTWPQLDATSRVRWGRSFLEQVQYARRLDNDRLGQLANCVFAGIEIGPASRDDLPLFEMYANHHAVAPELRERIEVCMSLARGPINAETMKQSHAQLSLLDAEKYRDALVRILPSYLQTSVPVEMYAQVVRGTYVQPYLSIFWDVHTELLIKTLSGDTNKGLSGRFGFRGRGNDAVEDTRASWFATLLDFWYVKAFQELSDAGFPVQEFFFHLPAVLAEVKQNSDWENFTAGVENQSRDAPWRLSIAGKLAMFRQGGFGKRLKR